MTSRQTYERAISYYGDQKTFLSALARKLDVDTEKNETDLKAEFLEAIDHTRLKAGLPALEQSGKTTNKFCVIPIKEFFSSDTIDDQWAALAGMFLVKAGTLRGSLGDKTTEKLDPSLQPWLKDLQETFDSANQRIKTAAAFSNTKALTTVLDSAFEIYAKKKAARGALDYEDLVSATRKLFESTGADWVRYKLDQGLDHISVSYTHLTLPTKA